MVIVVSARSVQSRAGLSRNGWFGYLLALRIGQWPPERARRMATCSAELVWQTVAFLHQIEAALVGRAWQSLQNTPETRQEGFIRRADYRYGYLSFNFEEKKMKNVLLATTAIALTAGYAAADVSYSASAKLAYGNFGTGTAATASYGYANETDFTVTGSGEAGGVSYSGALTLDEGGQDDTGAFSLAANGFTFVYDENDLGGLVDTGGDGEDDNAGDWKLSYAANGISASYEVDTATAMDGRYDLILGYAANGMSVGLHASDDDGKGVKTVVNTVSVGYTVGALGLSYKADDQATQNWDAGATYTMGATTLSAGTDEMESAYVGLSTSINGVTLTARSEADGNTAADTAENELSLSYTTGALTVAMARDTGNGPANYGDEAESVTTITYDLGGLTLQAKATNRSETEVSAAFSF